MGAETIQFYPLDITYRIVNEHPEILLFGRTDKNKQICILDTEFRPYFFVQLKKQIDIKKFQEKIKKIEIDVKGRTAKVTDTEVVEKKHLGKTIEFDGHLYQTTCQRKQLVLDPCKHRLSGCRW